MVNPALSAIIDWKKAYILTAALNRTHTAQITVINVVLADPDHGHATRKEEDATGRFIKSCLVTTYHVSLMFSYSMSNSSSVIELLLLQ